MGLEFLDIGFRIETETFWFGVRENISEIESVTHLLWNCVAGAAVNSVEKTKSDDKHLAVRRGLYYINYQREDIE